MLAGRYYVHISSQPFIGTALRRAKFRVTGMYCTTCKPIIEKQLSGEQAVKAIEIDYLTDSVVVKYDQSKITVEELKKRLENSGYRFSRVAR